MTTKLSVQNLAAIAASAAVPGYERSSLAAGIVHFGIGNFHRAHQAVYLDSLLTPAVIMIGPSSVRWPTRQFGSSQ